MVKCQQLPDRTSAPIQERLRVPNLLRAGHAFRAAGQGWETSYVMPPFIFPPGSISADTLTPGITSTRLTSSRIINATQPSPTPGELELGCGSSLWPGQALRRRRPKLLNGLIGGWQLSGDGTWYSRWVQPDGANWGAFNGFKTYGKQKVVNCTSGDCYNQFLWFNGYLDANVVNQQGGISGFPRITTLTKRP